MHGHVEGRVLAILIVRRQGVSLGRFNSMFMSSQSLIVQKKKKGLREESSHWKSCLVFSIYLNLP